jgi:hypothetical protein
MCLWYFYNDLQHKCLSSFKLCGMDYAFYKLQNLGMNEQFSNFEIKERMNYDINKMATT